MKQHLYARSFLFIFGYAIVSALAISIVLSVFVMWLSSNAHASETELPQMRINDAKQGTLLFKRQDNRRQYVSAPTLKTDVSMKITGMLARVTVEQHFTNPTQLWQEGIYVFPLPDDSAVDRLRMKIGERIIEGQIKEKQQARKIYIQAKKQGKKAALIEQQRPNIFTNAVANIGPGETVSITIDYQQRLEYVKDTFSLRFPTVVNPRYTPAATRQLAEVLSNDSPSTFTTGGWLQKTAITASREHVTLDAGHPVSINIELEAGLPLQHINSPYHKIDVMRHNRQHIITLNNKHMPADRDFVLSWQPVLNRAPQAALFTERTDQANYTMLMFMPPQQQASNAVRLSREVVFIIDTSGSMGGASIRQAQKALHWATTQLSPKDSFNIIQFNSSTHKLFKNSVAANQQNLSIAKRYIDNLRAGGGTEMMSALRAALANQSHETASRQVRQVVFLTDGSVSNEHQLFNYIQAHLRNTRLFTVGIGSAPNSFFMKKAAKFGRGTHTHIGDLNEVETNMRALFSSIEKPMLTNIKTQWLAGTTAIEQSDHDALQSYPARISDLYAGRPLVVVARLPDHIDGLRVTGMVGEHPWQRTFTLTGGAAHNGVAKRWAREKIASLMDSLQDGADNTKVRGQVTKTALTHHLVSKYTSLVAVDVTPTRPIESTLQTQRIKTPLPKGSDAKTFLGLPKTATPAELNLLLGLMALLLSLGLWFMSNRTTRRLY